MSQSTQDYISFAVKISSEQGTDQQGLRLHPIRVLRFVSVCVLLLILSSASYAQQFYWGSNNWTSNWEGIIRTSGGILEEPYPGYEGITGGRVIGATGWDAWWVDGNLTSYGGIHNLDILGVRGNFINNGIIENVSTIVLGDGNFFNQAGSTIRLNSSNEVIRITGGTAWITGGTVDVNRDLYTFEVGKQYLFLETDKPGGNRDSRTLVVDQGLAVSGSGEKSSVLDLVAVYGHWDAGLNKYVEGGGWDNDNQYYWLEAQRAYLYGEQNKSNDRYKTTRNQRQIGKYVDEIGKTVKQDSPLWNLFVGLDGISDDPNYRGGIYYDDRYKIHEGQINPSESQITPGTINPVALQALKELSGEIYSTVGIAQVHNVETINATLADALRSDIFKFSFIGNPNNAIRGQAIAPLRYSRWGTFFGIAGNTKSDGNASGYKHSFGGVMAGFDRAFWTGARVGGYLSVASGEVKLKSLDEHAEMTDVIVGMYLRQEMYYGYGLVSVGFGGDKYKTKRNLSTLGYRAEENKFNGTVGTLYAERGIDIPVYYATIQPYISVQSVSVSQCTFRETMWDTTGQYTNVGLQGVKGDTCGLTAAAGLRMASSPIPMPWGQIAATGKMSLLHDLSGEQKFVGRFYNPGDVNYTSSGAKFSVFGNKPRRDWLNLGLGVSMDRNSTRMFLSGDIYASIKDASFTGNGGFITCW